METLLTGAVNRLLRRFIKSASGEAGSTLRASLSASGSMVLYNLELDLQSLLSGWPFSVQRAFAHRLTVTVRWASLTIQVELDDVEVVLAMDDATGGLQPQPSGLADELGAVLAEEASEAPAAEGGASWFLDAFRPTLIQALANMTLMLRNVAVRCHASGVVASAACSLVRAASVADAGAASRPEDEGWLTKQLEVRALCLDVQQQPPSGMAPTLQAAPLLRTPRLLVSATLPALVLLGEAEGGAPPAIDVAVDLLPLSLSLSPQQLQDMAALAAALPQAQPADVAACAEPQQAAHAMPPPAEPGELPSPPEGVKAFGWAAWQYLTNEEANGAQTPAQQLDDFAISLTVKMQGGQARLLQADNTAPLLDGVPGSSPTCLAAVQLIGVSAEVQLLASDLQYAELQLHQLTVLRPPAQPLDPPWSPQSASDSPRPPAASSSSAGQEIFGLHPVRSGRQTTANMPLALWMQWQTGQSDSGAGTPVQSPSVSLRIGRLFAAHVPCFLEELQHFLTVEQHPSGTDTDAGQPEHPPAVAASGSDVAQEDTTASPPLLAQWLAAGFAADLVVSTVQIVLLAAADAPAEAVVLDVAKISGQLGPIKARTHSMQQSMAAMLLQQVVGSPPAYGLRVAVSGLQLSTVSVWLPGGMEAQTQGGSGGSSPTAATNPGQQLGHDAANTAQPVGSPVELQLLVAARSGSGGSGAKDAAGGSWGAWAVVSPVSLRLAAGQLAALLAAVHGLSAHRGCTVEPAAPASATPAAALGLLTISMASTAQLAYSPLGAKAVSASAAAEQWLSEASGLALVTESVEVVVASSTPGAELRLCCHRASMAAAPGFGLRVPVIEAGFGSVPDSTGSSTGQSTVQQHSSMPCRFTGLEVTQMESGASSQDSASSPQLRRLSLHLHSLSTALAAPQWQCALQTVNSLTSGPLLPPYTSYTAGPVDAHSAECGSELTATLGAALVTLHAAECPLVPTDSLSVAVSGAAYRLSQDVAGDMSATGRVQHLECCVHRAATPAFTSCLRAQQPCGESSGSAPPPLLQFSRTTQAQRPAVSHACLQLRRLELLIEPATVSCVARLMAHMPTHANVAPPPEEQTEEQGRSSFQLLTEGLLVRLHASSEVAPSAEAMACVLCTEAVQLVCNRPPAAAGRWGVQDCELQEVDVSVAGLTVTVLAAEVPPAARLLLAPQTWDLHLEQNASAASMAVLLRVGALTACASPAAAHALARLHAALMPRPTSDQPKAEAGSHPTPAAAATQQTDDLSCGLFSLSPELAGHPGAMQISLGDKAAGSMPWTGGGESWVCWRYSYARPVVSLMLHGGAAQIPPDEYELARLDAGSGEFVPLELNSVQLSSPAHRLTFAVKEPVAADEWQLSWTAETLQARDLLRHLRVNSTADLEQHNIAPLAVPLTLAVEAQALDVSLLGTSDAAAADDLEHLGSLQCVGLKAAMHVWHDGTWAARGSSELIVRLHEHNAAVLRPLLHVPQLAWCLEQSSQDQQPQHTMAQPAAVGRLLPPGRPLLVPQPMPHLPGMRVLLRAPGAPSSVRMDELSVYSLQRLATLLAAADTAADDIASDTEQQAAKQRGGIVLTNHCPVALRVRQVGSQAPITLESQSTRTLLWNLSPELAAGAERRIQLSESDELSDQAKWSQPAEVLSAGTTLLHTPSADGTVHAMAMTVTRVGIGWSVTLQPGVALRNLTGQAVHLHFTGQAASGSSARSATVEVPADPEAVTPVWLRHSKSKPSSMMVWLGGGSGWSRSLPVVPSMFDEAVELQAGGFDTSMPSLTDAHTGSRRVTAACSMQQQGGGQVVVSFLPLLQLHNCLPQAVEWQLLQGDNADGTSTPFAASGQLSPGTNMPVPGHPDDARYLQFRLGQAAASSEQPDSMTGSSTQGTSGGAANGLDPPCDGWSTPLSLGSRQASSSSWRMLAAADTPTAAKLPLPGTSSLVQLPARLPQGSLPAAGTSASAVGSGKRPGQLAVTVAAEKLLQGCSAVAFVLLAHGILHNCTSQDLVLEDPGSASWSAAASAGCTTAFSTGSPAAPPEQACLTLRLGTRVLTSSAFSLKHGSMHQLLLRDGATAGYFATVSIALRQQTGASQRQLSDVPQLHVTCCETFYVSNLSAQPVTLLPVEALRSVHQATVCSPGVTAPISVVWAGGNAATAAVPAAAGKAAAAADHADAQSSAATAPQQAPAAMWPCRVAVRLSADESGGIDGASGRNGNGGVDGVPTVSLAEPCQRRWLVVRNGGGTPQQLAYRLLRGNGRHHLVLYVDEQPPLRVVSTASVHLEVGLTTPQHQGMGRFTYGESVSQAFDLAPGQQVDCEVAAPVAIKEPEHAQQQQQHSAAANAVEEDEAAFMEQLAARSSAAMGPPPAMLRLRRASGGDHGALSGDAPWSPFCMLVPGHHSVGDWQVQISRYPGTLSVTVQDCSTHPGHSDPQPALPQPFACDVSIDSLQLDLWDDERRRLCGGRVSPAVDGTTTASAKHSSRVASTAQECGQQQLGRRLFSIGIDGLGLTALQRHTAGHGGVGLQQRRDVAVSASGLQIDSYLADAHFPVVCRSLPAPQLRGGHGATQPAFTCSVEVATVLHDDRQLAQALSNTWVRRVRVSLPLVALAADDALLTFGDTLQRTLQPADTLADTRATTAQHMVGTAAAAEHQNIRAEMHAEALTCAANRLLVEELDIGAVQLTLDIHVAEASPQRIPLDAHATPLALPPTAAVRLWAWPGSLVRGLGAHYLAEALLNAPQVLGSLDLVLNPTGLVRSIAAGVGDLVGLPLAALGRGSPAAFVAGLGTGSASLLRNLSGWTLTSIAGFSGTTSRLLERSLSVQQAARGGGGGGGARGSQRQQRRAPTTLAGGLSQGLLGLYSGVSSGVTGIVSAPLQGYTDGSGVVRGLGRGLAGAVGLPVSGALAAIEALTSGIAAASGVSPIAIAQRPVPDPASPHLAARPSLPRLAAHAAQAHALLGRRAAAWDTLLACDPISAQAAVLAVATSDLAEVLQLAAPVAIVAGGVLAVCEAGGSTLRLCLGLQGARLQLDAGRHSITVYSGAWVDAQRSGACSGDLRLVLRLAEPEYLTWAVLLTRAVAV